MMTVEYRQVDLFGGAIVAAIPASFGDVSEIRQVPDNQEVYLDSQGFTSIVFDILERIDQPDPEALRAHLQDIVGGDGDGDSTTDSTRIVVSGDASFSKLPPNTPAYNLMATSPPGEKQRGRANEPDFVAILMTLIRLEQQNTDLIIAINVPHIDGLYDKDEVALEKGAYGRLITQAMEYQRSLLQTLEIKDWELFVQD